MSTLIYSLWLAYGVDVILVSPYSIYLVFCLVNLVGGFWWFWKLLDFALLRNTCAFFF